MTALSRAEVALSRLQQQQLLQRATYPALKSAVSGAVFSS